MIGGLARALRTRRAQSLSRSELLRAAASALLAAASLASLATLGPTLLSPGRYLICTRAGRSRHGYGKDRRDKLPRYLITGAVFKV